MERMTTLSLRKTFTLIELLIVISIIAILAAMLLPALSRVKVKANRVMELSDRRQVGIATHMYATDNRGRFPTQYDNELWNQLHVYSFRGGTDFRTAIFANYIPGAEDLWDQFMFCQSDLLKARYPYANEWYGYRQTHYINGGTIGYYVTPPEGWNNVTWFCDRFDTSTARKADPGLPMWACMLFEKRSRGEWFGHDALANVEPYTLPVGANTVYIDGGGEWVQPRDLVQMTHRGGGEYWWIPNKNGAVEGATVTYTY